MGGGTDCLTFVWKEEITIHVLKLVKFACYYAGCPEGAYRV